MWFQLLLLLLVSLLFFTFYMHCISFVWFLCLKIFSAYYYHHHCHHHHQLFIVRVYVTVVRY